MSKIKSLILGSAAGLVAIGGAQAADLPVKAKAVEYVKVCSLYGAGFYYIPGSDTCLRIGGYLRAEVNFNSAAADAPYLNGAGGEGNRFTNDYQSRARIMMYIDTRTATEYGVVRTFAAFGPQFTTSGANGGPTGADVLGNSGLKIEEAFVQFAGFTFGRSASAYSTPWNGYPNQIGSGLFGGATYDSGVNNIQYAWQFGNGLSASIGLDEQSQSNRTSVLNLTQNSLTAASAQGTALASGQTLTQLGYYGGTDAPDIVGNFKIDQAWGLLQVSGAAHEVSGVGFGSTSSNVLQALGHPESKWGYAVAGALQLKNLPTGPGDDLKIEGTYTEGALKYILGQSGAAPANFAVYGTGTYATGVVQDAVYAGTSSGAANFVPLQLTKAYGMRGGFTHNWNAYWSSGVFGSYTHVDYNATASSLICSGYGTTITTRTGVCNPDYNLSQVGLITRWTPVKGLTFSGEGMWTNIDQKNTGTATITPPGSSLKPAGTYSFKDQDVYSGVLRVQRDF